MKFHHHALALMLNTTLALPAFAHAHLDSASPANGAVLTAKPKEIVLVFTEKLEARLSALTVQDAKGVTIGTSAPENDGTNQSSLRISLPELAPGTYTVNWRATSVDTHSTTGSYSFTLK